METQEILSYVIGAFQLLVIFFIRVLVQMFKMSLKNIEENFKKSFETVNQSFKTVNKSIDEIKVSRTNEGNEMFSRLRIIEKEYADRVEVKDLIKESKNG
jgi:uncharacterized protein Yka (UPF0111/DUF47 family)